LITIDNSHYSGDGFVSVFASTIELMMPAQVLDGPEQDWEKDSRFQQTIGRIRNAISLRYCLFMTVMLDLLLSYHLGPLGYISCINYPSTKLGVC